MVVDVAVRWLARAAAREMREIFRIGGITLGLEYADDALRHAMPASTARFLIDDAGDDDITLALTVEAMSELRHPGPLLFDSGGVWKMYEGEGGYRLDCASDSFGEEPYKSVLLDEELKAGRILLRLDAYAETMHPLDYPLDEVLVAHLLGRGRGVELHGCGIIDDKGRGQLFVGQSGAGKTTTAGLWLEDGPYEIVSDDRVIVREIDGVWRMFGTPWHGEAELCSASSAPLAAIHLLSQAARTELVDMLPAAAAASLFGCTFPPFYDAKALGFTLDCLDQLVRDVPVRLLRFLPDRSAVECVKSAA
jgi:hypothetical protein